MMGKVYLTGAGSGDFELLTLKALRLVREADVIVYDRLVNPDILKEAKLGCECIYVGKEDKHHILPQDEINALLYEKVQKHNVVLRLNSVIFPSYVQKGNLTVAFSTSGASPAFAKRSREHFEKIIPNSVGDFLVKMKDLRATMPKGKERMKYFDGLVEEYFKKYFR